jgi:phosphoribosylglycinamide formyltransferase 1
VSENPPEATALRVAVLVSGSGTLLQSLLDAADGRSPYRVCGVISDIPEAFGLERARNAGVPTATVRPADFPDRPAWDEAVARATEVFSPDLVVCAGFMRLLGDPFLRRFGGRTINSHPALLPAFPGAHGVRDALAYGVKVTGCSIILVSNGVDDGPVVAQVPVEVDDADDEETLHGRIKVRERELLVDVVTRMAEDGWSVTGRTVRMGTAAPGTSGPAGRNEG